MASATIDIHFVMVDGWHRPVFVDKHKNFYGSTGKLFSRDVTEHEVLDRVTEEDITFFGRKFGCEPMGTPAGNVKIIRKNPVEVEPMTCTLRDKELIETAKSLIDGLCQSGGKTWTMRVPVDFDRDHDIILTEVVKRFENSISTTKEARDTW